jgi:hypothetical protein
MGGIFIRFGNSCRGALFGSPGFGSPCMKRSSLRGSFGQRGETSKRDNELCSGLSFSQGNWGLSADLLLLRTAPFLFKSGFTQEE